MCVHACYNIIMYASIDHTININITIKTRTAPGLVSVLVVGQ